MIAIDIAINMIAIGKGKSAKARARREGGKASQPTHNTCWLCELCAGGQKKEEKKGN